MKARLAVAVGAGLLAAAAAGALALALLRPASSATNATATSDRVVLAAPGERRSLPGSIEELLNPPPERIDLATLRGPAFVNVWASWCPSCEEEAPTMARLAREFRGRVRFVGIDVEDTRGAGRSFVRRHGLAFPHLFDRDASLARKLGVFGVPTAFLVDRDGRVAATLVGRQTERKLRSALRALAAER